MANMVVTRSVGLTSQIYRAALVSVIFSLAIGQAHAATKSRNFNVRVRIVKTCRVAATAMNFGNLGTVLGTETSTSTLTVNCSKGTPYNVSLRAGAALTTQTVNLTNPGGSIIQAGLTLGATAGTTSGSHPLIGKLVARAYPPIGRYQRTQTIYVNY